MNENNQIQRTRTGKLAGLVGIVCNLLLAGGKIAVGAWAHSMSALADGLNNLSDATGSVVTLLGFKFAEKPADKEHPYGHARFEYLASLTVSVLILVIGFELAKSSVEKIIRPTPVEVSPLMMAVLVISVLVKLLMFFFNRRTGRAIQSPALMAAAADSRNDAITTAAVILAAVIEQFTDLRVDGIMGLLVSLFILYSGISLAKETVSPLLGEGADSELHRRLTDYIGSCDMVIGCHDLMVHDYGPGKRYASIHVEMDKDVDAMVSHEAIDSMERECLEQFGVHLVIHYDPVSTNDPETQRLKQLVLTILKLKDERLEIHDFRVVTTDTHHHLTFDMVVPEDLQSEQENIKSALEHALGLLNEGSCTLSVTFDLC